MKYRTDWTTVNQEEKALDMFLDFEDQEGRHAICRAVTRQWCNEKQAKRKAGRSSVATPISPPADACRERIGGLLQNIQSPGRLQLLLKLAEAIYLHEVSERNGQVT